MGGGLGIGCRDGALQEQSLSIKQQLNCHLTDPFQRPLCVRSDPRAGHHTNPGPIFLHPGDETGESESQQEQCL